MGKLRHSQERTRLQRGGSYIPKFISKTGRECHSSGYQFIEPGTKLEERLSRGDQGMDIHKDRENSDQGGTLVRVFLCPCVGPFPLVGLTLSWFIWGRKLALHITL